jgi:hypothetical protein
MINFIIKKKLEINKAQLFFMFKFIFIFYLFFIFRFY